MTIILIRHGLTQGNIEKRYVGRTDESLAEEGIRALKQKKEQWNTGPSGFVLPAADRVVVSPMKRCRETAALLFPELVPVVQEEMRECDFGDFEYRNYIEMEQDPAYRAWVDGGGRDPFPGGEDPEAFRNRSVKGFQMAMARLSAGDGGNKPPETIAFVVHGGTIMAVMAALGKPEKEYFDWQISAGNGILCRYVPEQERCLVFLREL